MRLRKLLLGLVVALPMVSAAAFAQAPAAAPVTVTEEFRMEIPNIPGKSLVVVRVEYEPGATSAAHSHASSAFIYARVIEGQIRSQVNDADVRVYSTGEFWFENPGDRHNVSENASTTERAVLIAVFVVDSNETPLTML